MATKKQADFFDQLLGEKDFGDKNIDELRDKFSALNDSSASAWIEAAIKLDKKDESAGEDAPPPF